MCIYATRLALLKLMKKVFIFLFRIIMRALWLSIGRWLCPFAWFIDAPGNDRVPVALHSTGPSNIERREGAVIGLPARNSHLSTGDWHLQWLSCLVVVPDHHFHSLSSSSTSSLSVSVSVSVDAAPAPKKCCNLIFYQINYRDNIGTAQSNFNISSAATGTSFSYPAGVRNADHFRFGSLPRR